MVKLRKLTNSILNLRAVKVLGAQCYLALVWQFLRNLHKVIELGNLSPVDRAMANTCGRFSYRNKKVRIDCSYCDAAVADGTFTFGSVREILIRDCYLGYLPLANLDLVKTAVDLGANRGVFTVLAGTLAERVLSVEAQPHFRPVIEHNVKLNAHNHVQVATAIVGAGGSLSSRDDAERADLNSLLDRYEFDFVDLLKMDIEGSEFTLFSDPTWLSRVGCLTMEVHRKFGDPATIAQTLKRSGFLVKVADCDLRLVTTDQRFDFLYAWRNAA